MRVDVVSESDDLVAGNAVADIIHLIAELIENATVFSPPNTRSRSGPSGWARASSPRWRTAASACPRRTREINARLASPPEFDLADSKQLGLFVVGQLAARHEIKVSLRRSPYGGTTAVVLMPFGVVVRQEEAGQRRSPRRPARRARAADATGRHRLLTPGCPRPEAPRRRRRSVRDARPGPGCAERGGRMAAGTVGDRADPTPAEARHGRSGAGAVSPRRRPRARQRSRRRRCRPRVAASGCRSGAAGQPGAAAAGHATPTPVPQDPAGEDEPWGRRAVTGGDPEHAHDDAAGVAARADGRSRRPRGRAGYGN